MPRPDEVSTSSNSLMSSPRPMPRPEPEQELGYQETQQPEQPQYNFRGNQKPDIDPNTGMPIARTLDPGLEEDVQQYLNKKVPMSPVDKAIERGFIGGEDEYYKSKVSKATPEGRSIINSMYSNLLGTDVTKDPNFDTTAAYYCATFVGDILDSLGADPLKSSDKYDKLRANAYLKYGSQVDKQNAREGDIVIFDFDFDGKGDHATFYAGDRKMSPTGYISVLGGNQGENEEVGFTTYPEDNILGIRRIQYDNIDYEFTKELAEVNPDFNKFLDEQTKGFDWNAFVDKYYNPVDSFAKGGLNMDNQMKMAFMFEEGGIADDGMNVDPVSGNEIPPGSLAKEVRDDVPAQLSEGEYVVPADVVRYYGVKFFEDLRSEAKNGLMDMETNGRIGGEPVAQTMANQTEGDLTPEELAAVQEAMNMATGGMVLKAADGVDVSTNIDPYKPQFTAAQGSMFAPGYLIDQTAGTTAAPVQTVTLYGPNGEVVTLTLPAQQARMDELLQAGYSSQPVQVTTETSIGQEDGGDSSPMAAPNQAPKPVDYSKMSNEQLINAAKAFNIMGTMGSVLAATMSTPIGVFVNVGVANQYNNLLDTMAARGIDVSGMKRKGSIFGGEGTLTENLQDIGGAVDANGKVIGDGKVSFGDTWLGDLLGFDGKVGVDGPGLKDSWGGARRTSGTTTTTSTTDKTKTVVTPKKTNKNVGDDTPSSLAPTSSPRPVSRPASVGSKVDTTDDARASRGTGSMSSGERASQSYQKQEDTNYGLMNKGGMVKRRKKK